MRFRAWTPHPAVNPSLQLEHEADRPAILSLCSELEGLNVLEPLITAPVNECPFHGRKVDGKSGRVPSVGDHRDRA